MDLCRSCELDQQSCERRDKLVAIYKDRLIILDGKGWKLICVITIYLTVPERNCHFGMFHFTFNGLLQGVTWPTKYHLLWNDDDNMTTDEIERLTYYLCHLFSRCTRSVSYPAPTYNAHLAAYWAGVYLEGWVYSFLMKWSESLTLSRN